MNSAEEMKIKQYLSKYQHPETTRKDVINTLKQYRGLIAKLEQFMFNDGTVKELVNVQGTIPVPYKVFSNGTTKQLCQLCGTIPVPFKGNIYNIPVIIWLMDTHPYNAPICYVNPTSDMEIKISMFVDHNGKIYLPYLHEWDPNNSDLLGVIQVMICTFGEKPPVYAKPKDTAPYPTQSFLPTGTNPSQATPYSPFPGPRPVYPATSNSGFSSFPTPYPPAPTNELPSRFPSYQPPYTIQSGLNPLPSSFSSMPGYPPYPQQTPTSGGGTISEEHIRASLLSAVEDKLKRRMKEHLSQAQAELETLNRTQQELSQGRTKLDDMLRRLEQEQVDLDKSITLLRDKEQEIEKAIAQLSEQEPIDVDEAVTTTAPLYKQLLNAFTEEAATEDAIYYMGEALRRGVIDLDVFLKQIRQLSRKQFMLRALMQKCRQKAGLAG